jgi:hypothetical protein
MSPCTASKKKFFGIKAALFQESGLFVFENQRWQNTNKMKSWLYKKDFLRQAFDAHSRPPSICVRSAIRQRRGILRVLL